jgi:hypothetical protein
LSGLALLLIFQWLKVDPPPPTSPFGIAFQSPVPVKQGRGFALEVTTTVDRCGQPVAVVATAVPSAEFWQDHSSKFPSWASFAFAIQDRVTDVRLAPASLSGALILASGVSLLSTSYRRATTFVHGGVRDWPSTRGGVSIEFKTNWSSARSGPPLLPKTCYLRLPSLTGLYATAVALGFGSNPYPLLPTGYIYGLGKNLVDSYGDNDSVAANTVSVPGDVENAASSPQPQETTSVGSTWRCTSRAPTVSLGIIDHTGPSRGLPLPSRLPNITGFSKGFAQSLTALAASESQRAGCSALVVVDDPNAGLTRDFGIAILGAAVALMLEPLVTSRRARA